MDIDYIFRPNLNNEIFALQNIGYTISDLAKIFDKTITKRLYNDLSELNKNNITFLNIYFCKDLGKFSTSDLNCLCHLGIFGGHCQTYGIEIWGKAGNLVFQIIFGNIFFILMSIMIFRLVSSIKNSNHNTICSLITFIISTPKNLVNLNLFIITIIKFIYMIIDPYCQHKYVSYKYDRVIDELKFSGVISIYFILFIVFVGLNANLRRGKGNISKKNYICAYKLIKVIVIIILFWIYPSQISVSALLSENDAQLGGMIVLVFGGLFLAFCLYVTTFWILFYLRNKLFKQYQIKKRNLRKEKIKITEIENLYDINNNEMEILNSENHLLSKDNCSDDINLFLDMDMEIISEDNWEDYENKIKNEYCFVSPETYKTKRKEFLQKLENKSKIFRTKTFFDEYENKARNNIKNILKKLSD